MLKSIFGAAIFLLITLESAHAEQKAVTMSTMLDGMNMVQLGFLTNTRSFIEEGVFQIQRGREALEVIDNSHYLSFDEVRGFAYTKQKTTKIYDASVLLLEKYEDGKVFEAMDEYKNILNQCLECHDKLRDFKDRGSKLR